MTSVSVGDLGVVCTRSGTTTGGSGGIRWTGGFQLQQPVRGETHRFGQEPGPIGGEDSSFQWRIKTSVGGDLV